MKKTDTIELIRGTFTPEEAREILVQLFVDKMNFHNLRNLSSQERFGRPDAYSEQRLEKLKESRAAVETIISRSIDEKKNLKINSNIEIEIE